MVRIVGDDAFKLSVQMFSDAASNRISDPSAVDMDFRGSIGGVHIVYLHQTIMDILVCHILVCLRVLADEEDLKNVEGMGIRCQKF